MARSHGMGVRGFLIAAFLVVAPLVAVFQGPVQDRFETLFGRSAPKPATIASAEPSGNIPSFRPVVRGDKRGDDDSAPSDTVTRRSMFPGEPDEAQFSSVVERRHRLDGPRPSRSAKSSTDPDSLFPSDDGAIAQRSPTGESRQEVQTDFQDRNSAAESPKRQPSRTDLGDRSAKDRRIDDRRAAGRRPVEKGRDGAGDLAAAVDDVMEKAGGGRPKAVSSDPLARPYAKLRDLGATSSRLETWGTDGDRYRFQCRVATDADATETQHFEATDEQPLRAIERVVQQVEAWQGQRR
jgi:hypothetical protein